MSRLKFSSNLFLEVNELKRFEDFIGDQGWKRAMKALTNNFGIVQDNSNSYFKVTQKSGSNSTVVINAGLAFDSSMNAIVMKDDLELQIANTGENRWIVLSRSVTNEEQGSVSINSDGSLSGSNTEFTKVLRGQPNFPVKVKFTNSNQNTSEYEVVSVTSDTSALLSGSFVKQDNLKYAVIGTFTPGFQPTDENKMIYEYDSYAISIIDSESRPEVNDDEFILAMVSFNASGAINVSDERIRSMFNNPYIQNSDIENSYDPIVSLLSTGIVGGIYAQNDENLDIELIIEHGYTITKQELISTSTSNTLNILSGSCNFLGSGDIPDGIFKGWLLINRANMKYAVIDDNENKSLFISNLDSSLILENGNDLVVVPNVKEIEYEIKVSSNVDRPQCPFFFKNSIENPSTRTRIYIHYPMSGIEGYDSDSVSVSMRYRLIDNSGKIYPFSNFSVSQFENVNGQSETLANSSFNINVAEIKPQEKQRNYS